jgi:hypothetical protein
MRGDFILILSILSNLSNLSVFISIEKLSLESELILFWFIFSIFWESFLKINEGFFNVDLLRTEFSFYFFFSSTNIYFNVSCTPYVNINPTLSVNI